MADLSTTAVFALFIAGALVTHVAGVNLGKATDFLDERYGLGDGAVGIVMTAVFVAGILLRPSTRHWRLGADSWAAAAIYALGLWGLVYISS